MSAQFLQIDGTSHSVDYIVDGGQILASGVHKYNKGK